MWTSSKSYDNKDQVSKSFLFTGGYLTIDADTKTSYEDAVKEADAAQKKSHDSDSEYAYTDEETTVLGVVKAKKYEVNYVSAKVPYKETTYIFSQNQISYTVTLRMDEAVRTEANEARLNKAFASLKFMDAVNK